MTKTTASTAKKSTSATSAAEQASETAKRAAKDFVNDASDAAKAGLDRVKDPVPSVEGVAETVQDYVHDHTNVDLQKMADDAAGFVRKNPGTSLAAAAGLGVLIGVALAKRY